MRFGHVRLGFIQGEFRFWGFSPLYLGVGIEVGSVILLALSVRLLTLELAFTICKDWGLEWKYSNKTAHAHLLAQATRIAEAQLRGESKP